MQGHRVLCLPFLPSHVGWSVLTSGLGAEEGKDSLIHLQFTYSGVNTFIGGP